MDPAVSFHPKSRVLLALGLVSVVAGLVVGCSMGDSRTTGTSRDLRELLVDETSLPGDWIADPEGPHEVRQAQGPLGGGIGALRTMSLRFMVPVPGGSGSAQQEIYEFADSKAAAGEFEVLRVRWFPVGPFDTPWESPPGFACTKFSADGFYAGCSNQGGISTCQMIAQYGRYLVRFDASMNAYDTNLNAVEVMTHADFERVLQDIDERLLPHESEA